MSSSSADSCRIPAGDANGPCCLFVFCARFKRTIFVLKQLQRTQNVTVYISLSKRDCGAQGHPRTRAIALAVCQSSYMAAASIVWQKSSGPGSQANMRVMASVWLVLTSALRLCGSIGGDLDIYGSIIIRVGGRGVEFEIPFAGRWESIVVVIALVNGNCYRDAISRNMLVSTEPHPTVQPSNWLEEESKC